MSFCSAVQYSCTAVQLYSVHRVHLYCTAVRSLLRPEADSFSQMTASTGEDLPMPAPEAPLPRAQQIQGIRQGICTKDWVGPDVDLTTATLPFRPGAPPFDMPLHGVRIVISGIVNPERQALKMEALGLGATYSRIWSHGCTHCIAAFDGTAKCVAARASGGLVVKPGWLDSCTVNCEKSDEDCFLFPSHVPLPPRPSLGNTLERHWGYSSFRDGQLPVIKATLAGRDVTVFWATGSGKSICYQLPALHLNKVVVVISPLISLMQDQVRRTSPVFGSRCRRVSCPLAQGQPCVRPRPTAPRAGR